MRARNDFASILMDELESYTQDIAEKVYKEAELLTRQAKADLAEVPIKRTGVYRKSWKIAKFKGKYGFRTVLHNDPKYRLTHLLENGFIHFPDGSTIPGRPHIDPEQELLNDEFYNRVCEIIEKEE